MKTPISYYGGKQAMLHVIIPMVPEHDLYTEVFFGGGSDTLQEFVNKNGWNKKEISHRLQAPNKKMGKKSSEILIYNYDLQDINTKQQLNLFNDGKSKNI